MICENISIDNIYKVFTKNEQSIYNNQFFTHELLKYFTW